MESFNEWLEKTFKSIDPLIIKVIPWIFWTLVLILLILPFIIMGLLIDLQIGNAILTLFAWMLVLVLIRLMIWFRQYRYLYGFPYDFSNHKTLPDEPISLGQKEWKLPSTDMLKQDEAKKSDNESVESKQAKRLLKIVNEFGCPADIISVDNAPQIITYHFKPKVGERVKDPERLERAIAQTLDIPTVKAQLDENLNGNLHIEIARKDREVVRLRALLESEDFNKSEASLPIILGIGQKGEILVKDLTNFPHLLISGQTKSGKSVFMNSLIMSLVYKHTPDELRFVMIDPKFVELGVYEDIPHLLYPVINEPEEAKNILTWLLVEMEERYRKLAKHKVREISEYNKNVEEKIPYIVVVIDELADLMMLYPEDIEPCIVAIAQKARAVGIHLVIATQRPDVSVITGLIKANVPGRIAFETSEGIDSRVIIDQNGAERLLGSGDMYFMTYDLDYPIRIQGAYINTEDTCKITDFLREQAL